MATVTDVRLVIADQRTVAQSVMALLRTFEAHLHHALTLNDERPLAALMASIHADAASWTDAVLANTSAAIESAGGLAEPTPAPKYVAHLFAIPPVVPLADLPAPRPAAAAAQAPQAETAPNPPGEAGEAAHEPPVAESRPESIAESQNESAR